MSASHELVVAWVKPSRSWATCLAAKFVLKLAGSPVHGLSGWNVIQAHHSICHEYPEKTGAFARSAPKPTQKVTRLAG